MGVLHQPESDIHHALPARSLVGRAAACDLRLESRRVSGEHARLAWADGAWEVRDLGSRNGTFVNGRRLEPGESAALRAGDRLAFGDARQEWALVDAAPPAAIARDPATGARRVEADGLLSLPGAEAPRVCVFEGPDGGWVAERDGAPEPARDGQLIQVDGAAWMLHLPTPIDRTWDAGGDRVALETLALTFRVSADEEHVEIQVAGPRGTFEMPSRAHNYLTLTLARARLADRDEEVSESEEGWRYVDELCRMLRVDNLRINTDIYRSRRDLGRRGVSGAANLFERRPLTRQVRLGVSEVRVERI